MKTILFHLYEAKSKFVLPRMLVADDPSLSISQPYEAHHQAPGEIQSKEGNVGTAHKGTEMVQ